MTTLIDLTQPIFSGMTVYPGDPIVTIVDEFSHEKEGYVISKLSLGNHTGTHIDAPSHMVADGKSLDDFPIEYFCGEAVKYVDKWPDHLHKKKYPILIIENIAVTDQIVEEIVKLKPRLLGFGQNCGWTIPLIKKLLENEILLVGRLVHVDKLPKHFFFSAFPLAIKKGNGSPVRAVAFL
jgi:arylformamidase